MKEEITKEELNLINTFNNLTETQKFTIETLMKTFTEQNKDKLAKQFRILKLDQE